MSDSSNVKKTKKDVYANVAFASVTLSAANTLTFKQVQFAVGLFQGVGLLLHRLLWVPAAATIRELVAATDSLIFAMCTSNRLASLTNPLDPTIISLKHIVGIGAAVEPWVFPLIDDFTILPGGGKLVPANPLWIGCVSAGAVSIAQVDVTLEFTFVELSDKDYLELLQAQFPVNL